MSLRTLVLIALLLKPIGSVHCQEVSAKRVPNIILIMADDLGFETIGANGGESYQTPNLDQMAKAGVRFEHCYSQPLCTPSRVQLMTGKYNFRNYSKFGELRRGERTFAHFLKEAGYATCVAGKWQLGKQKDSPQHFGFEQSLLWQHTRSGRLVEGTKRFDKRYENPLLEKNGEPLSFSGGEFAPDLMVDFICDFIDSHQKKPFFIYYPMILTHCPFVPVPGSPSWNPNSKGSPTYKGDATNFSEMVCYMDKLVGRIMKRVEDNGVAENTVILFTGDNGTDKPVVSRFQGKNLAGGKGSMKDSGTRVPLICVGSGRFKKSVCRDIVDFTDFLPTLVQLAGVEPTELNNELDGRSFLPQLVGKKGSP
ncbi:MAG: sulfatase-like hydrolase/transferase, partial [Planctomycetota bacterium]